MKEFDIYQDKIIYKDGWFVYIRENGQNSVLTRQAAHKVEEDYLRYQAEMDVNRGGMNPNTAYRMRGFSKKKDYQYIFTALYETDKLADSRSDQQFSETLTIPEKIGDVEINCVSSASFAGISSLREVILPESIRRIESDAFKDCRHLQKVHLPSEGVSILENAFDGTMALETDSHKVSYLDTTLIKADACLQGEYCVREGTVSISDKAFSKCEKLTKIIIPNSVKIIGAGAFYECSSLCEVTLPEHLIRLGDSAFYKCCALTSVCIPEGIHRLERGTFQDCTELSEVHLPHFLRAVSFDSLENTAVVNKFKEEKNPALYIDDWLICYKKDFTGELHIKPGTIGIADSYIGMGYRELSRIEIPAGIRHLGMGSFEGCHNITRIELPEGIENVGKSALRRCSSLKAVVFPKSLKTLDIWNIMNCDAIEEVTFLNPETEITWPAITGRDDKQRIVIAGHHHSTAQRYCEQYGEKYHLEFKLLETE